MTFKNLNFTALIAVSSLSCLTAAAIVAYPGLIPVRQADGTTINIRLEGNEEEHAAYTEDGRLLVPDENGYYVLASEAQREAFKSARRVKRGGPGLMFSGYPAFGERRAIVVLVEFKNQEFTIPDPNDFYTRMLNEEGFSDYDATGSARDYFIESSDSIFRPAFDVYGPVKLSQNYSYYGQNTWGGNDARPEQMVIEACQLLDDEVDFSLYDNDGNGVIDCVYVFYAGFGEADGGNANTIWPHSWDISQATSRRYLFDDVRLDHYACSNEMQTRTRQPDGIGTFCHEFGHVLGLPDLYSTMYTQAFTPAEWDIMDRGSYNHNSRTPPYYSAAERYSLDWLKPETLSPGEKTLLPLNEENAAFFVPTDKENEYYIIENRQQQGFDAYVPGHGMVIWHIDFVQSVWNNNTVNISPNHLYWDMIEADGVPTVATRDGDAFPGRFEVTEYSPETRPAWRSWSGEDMPFRIFDIAESEEGIITFSVEKYGDSEEEPGVDPENPDKPVIEPGRPGIDPGNSGFEPENPNINPDKPDIEPSGDAGMGYVMNSSLDIRIQGRRVINNGNGRITIFDLTGNRILTLSSEAVLSPGVYFATDGSAYLKFIISN